MTTTPAIAPLRTGSFEDLVLDFIAYLELERGLSRNTLEAYRSDLLQYGAFLDRAGRDALRVTHTDLAAFVDDLATGGEGRPPGRPRPSSARSRACARSTVTCAARRSSTSTRPPS